MSQIERGRLRENWTVGEKMLVLLCTVVSKLVECFKFFNQNMCQCLQVFTPRFVDYNSLRNENTFVKVKFVCAVGSLIAFVWDAY
jgi:hypothetical protein